MKKTIPVKSKPTPVVDVLPTVPPKPVATIDPVIEAVNADVNEAAKVDELEPLKVNEPDMDAPAAKKEDEEEEEQYQADEDWNFERGMLSDFIAPYLDTYPDEKEFHITSDGQVFLKANARDAAVHQKTLRDEAEVFVFAV